MHARAWIRSTTSAALMLALLCTAHDAATGVPCGAPRPTGDPLLIAHPKQAKAVTVNLVQAHEVCFVPDTTTEGGASACTAETRNQAASDPMTGWRWGTSKPRGILTLTAACPGAADVGVTLDLAGVVDGMGTPVSGTGTLQLGAMLSIDDPMSGSMTAVQMPMTIPVTLTDGAVKFRTTANAMLGTAALPPLPNVTSFELAPPDMFDAEAGLMEVRDPNGTVFLRPGIETFSTAGTAPCDVAHGGKSKPVSLSLVQAYFPCDPMFATSVTEGGVASCAPAETFNETNGSPANGWTWGPSGVGTVKLFPKKAAACVAKNSAVPAACPGGLNPEGDTSDVVVTLKLSGVVDQVDGAANGTGRFAVFAQTTMHDRVNGPLTFFDVMGSQFMLANGRATVKTSYNATLNNRPHPGLPPCASLELVGATVTDENFDTFAAAGLWLP